MSRRASLRAKRAFDLVVGGLSALVLSPLWLTASVVVGFTLGRPLLFKQVRLGLDGRPFTLYKFRTMTAERDGRGELLPDEQRITRAGRLLRTTTLDELPEIINVLRGDMSVVGPRPLLPEYWDLYSTRQRRRHDVPPGMAGPVAAGGRNALSWDEKFALDVAYVDNWSLLGDVAILVRSVGKVLRREGINADGHATMPRFEGSSADEGAP